MVKSNVAQQLLGVPEADSSAQVVGEETTTMTQEADAQSIVGAEIVKVQMAVANDTAESADATKDHQAVEKTESKQDLDIEMASPASSQQSTRANDGEPSTPGPSSDGEPQSMKEQPSENLTPSTLVECVEPACKRPRVNIDDSQSSVEESPTIGNVVDSLEDSLEDIIDASQCQLVPAAVQKTPDALRELDFHMFNLTFQTSASLSPDTPNIALSPSEVGVGGSWFLVRGFLGFPEVFSWPVYRPGKNLQRFFVRFFLQPAGSLFLECGGFF